MTDSPPIRVLPIRVLIVDDQPVVRSGLRTFLLAFEALELVGEAASGAEAIECCRQLAPDVVLMDLIMPDLDGVVAIRAIHQHDPRVRVVALTNFADDVLVTGALEAGASGYLLKNVTAEELFAAILAANAGRSVLAPEVTRRLVEGASRPPLPGPPLSAREREVLTLMVQGRSNTGIADHLTISRSTVKFHVGSIFRKLGVVSRTEAVARAVQLHLVEGAGLPASSNPWDETLTKTARGVFARSKEERRRPKAFDERGAAPCSRRARPGARPQRRPR